MADNGTFMIYEEPGRLFDRAVWLAFRDQMLREVELHPNWPEAHWGLKDAEEHLIWIDEWERAQALKQPSPMANK